MKLLPLSHSRLLKAIFLSCLFILCISGTGGCVNDGGQLQGLVFSFYHVGPGGSHSDHTWCQTPLSSESSLGYTVSILIFFFFLSLN